MFKHLLELTPGAAALAIGVLLLFFSLFVGIVIWAVRVNKGYINRMKNLPLETSNFNGEKND